MSFSTVHYSIVVLTVGHNKSAIDLPIPLVVTKSTTTTRYSDQQGSKSRQKVMSTSDGTDQWFIKPPYVEQDRLGMLSPILSKKPEKLSNQYQQVQVSRPHMYRNRKIEIPSPWWWRPLVNRRASQHPAVQPCAFLKKPSCCRSLWS